MNLTVAFFSLIAFDPEPYSKLTVKQTREREKERFFFDKNKQIPNDGTVFEKKVSDGFVLINLYQIEDHIKKDKGKQRKHHKNNARQNIVVLKMKMKMCNVRGSNKPSVRESKIVIEEDMNIISNPNSSRAPFTIIK